jgi:hypothetical protein
VIADVEVDRAGFGQRRIAPRCQTKQAAKGRDRAWQQAGLFRDLVLLGKAEIFSTADAAAVELEVGRQDEHDQLFIRLADERFGAAG